jgi:hypothetical protein
MNKYEQIEAVRHELRRLDETIGGLDEGALTAVGIDQWSIREVIAHITGWALLDTRILQRLARGERPLPEGEEYGTGEERNPGFASEARTRSGAEIIAEMRGAFEELLAAASELPEDRFEQGRTAQRIMESDGSGHLAEHRREIEAFVASLRR